MRCNAISSGSSENDELSRKVSFCSGRRFQLAVTVTAPLLQALCCRCRRVNSPFEDRGSALEGGVKVCKRPLVNEVVGLLMRTLVTLQTLSHGVELICNFKQGSSCVEFLSLVSK